MQMDPFDSEALSDEQLLPCDDQPLSPRRPRSGRGPWWIRAAPKTAGAQILRTMVLLCPVALAGLLLGQALWARTGLRTTSRAGEATSLVAVAPAPATKKPPHLIFVLIDDLGFNDFKDSKDLGVSWPNVKKLANRSIFVNTTMTEAWCAPSRAALLTGRYFNLLSSFDFSSKDETTIAQRLNKEGYMSYAVGKWHLGWKTWAMTPTGRGFHRYFGNFENPGDHYTHCSTKSTKSSGGAGVKQPLYYDQSYMERYPFVSPSASDDAPFWDVAEGSAGMYDTVAYDKAAQSFLRQHKEKFPDKPFFLYYALYADHHPYQADKRWVKDCPEESAEGRFYLCGMQVAADSAIMNLTQMIEATFGSDEYVAILTGDNGGMIGKGKMVPGWSNNEPLRGMKFTNWDGGITSRAMVWGRQEELMASTMLGKTYMGGFMHLVDWTATLAELGGAPADGGRFPFSGKSVWQALLSNGKSPRDSMYIKSGGTGKNSATFFRQGDWVLMSSKSNSTQKVNISAPPVFPVPKSDYKEGRKDFQKYRSSHKGPIVTLPAVYNIWDDISMEVPQHTDKVGEMLTAQKQWLAASGIKSKRRDDDCPNTSCRREREAAKDAVTRALKVDILGKGKCTQRAFYPYWDVPRCDCFA